MGFQSLQLLQYTHLYISQQELQLSYQQKQEHQYSYVLFFQHIFKQDEEHKQSSQQVLQ